MIYIATGKQKQNILRINRRREEQNRSVDPRDVLRRYDRSLETVEHVARSCEAVHVFDNSRSAFVELLTIRNGEIESIRETTKWREVALATSLAAFRSHTPR